MPENFYITWNKQVGPETFDVSTAAGDEFILSDGRHIFDFASTSFQASFGHSNDIIRRRIHEQLDVMPIASPKSVFELKRRVTAELIRLLNLGSAGGSGKVFYTVSGAESVENALKIARHLSGRPIILARQNSYHGATLGAMSVSGDWRSHHHLNFGQGTVRIPEPTDDPDGVATRRVVEQTGSENVAALIVETISGVNGVVIPPQSWWDAISTMCSELGILLIADEVLVGFGRTGPAFGIHHFGVRPDMVCMSKAITGGYVPFGALWTSDAVGSHYEHQVLACGLTNYAHPLGLAALDGVIQQLDNPAFQRNKAELENIFQRHLRQLADRPSITGVRDCGLLAAIDFANRAPSWRELMENGIHVVVNDKRHMIVLAPPLVSEPARLDQAFASLHDTIESMESRTVTA